MLHFRCVRGSLWLRLFASLLVATPALAQVVSDPNLQLSTVVNGGLTAPTGMAFVSADDFLVIEKDGVVRYVENGVLQATPALTVTVTSSSEYGLLGIAVNTETPRKVFLYYTQNVPPIRNRVYRYTWNAATKLLESPQLILDLPGLPGPNHDGGILVLGPPGQAPGVGDGSLLYVVIGDLNRTGQLQNIVGGAAPDDTGVIFRVRQDGTAAPGNPFMPYCAGQTTQTCDEDSDCGGNAPCVLAVARYFAYGVRNSFGMTLDPATGRLWNTENGPGNFDEVNRVPAGMNSGWNPIMGPDALDPEGVGDLWNMPGAGSTYNDPEFSWTFTIAPTAIVLPYGSSLGADYDDVAIVADYNYGQIYALPLDATRMGFDFSAFPDLQDLVANHYIERDLLKIGNNFDGMSDLKVGPDLALYVVSLSGSIYRITGPGPSPPPVPGLPASGIAVLACLLAGAAASVLARRWKPFDGRLS